MLPSKSLDAKMVRLEPTLEDGNGTVCSITSAVIDQPYHDATGAPSIA
jgi:hypothetical protein